MSWRVHLLPVFCVLGIEVVSFYFVSTDTFSTSTLWSRSSPALFQCFFFFWCPLCILSNDDKYILKHLEVQINIYTPTFATSRAGRCTISCLERPTQSEVVKLNRILFFWCDVPLCKYLLIELLPCQTSSFCCTNTKHCENM